MRLALAFVLTLAGTLPALDTITISSVPDTAAEQGTVPAVFRVSRGGATNGALSVQVTLSGTAGGADYTVSGLVAGSVTIPDGSSTADIIITPIDDGSVEMRETVIATIDSSAAYLRSSVYTKTMLIADNDLRVNWDVIKEDASEFLSGGTPPEAAVRMSFSQPPPTAVVVQFQLLSVASAPEDTPAELGTDFLMTYMHRNVARSPATSILTDRSIVLNPGTETWSVGSKLDADAFEGDDQVHVGTATDLQVGDRIQIGSDPFIYSVDSISADVAGFMIGISPDLQSDVSENDPVRNNPDVLITTNGSIQGFYVASDEDAIDLAITPVYDNVAEGGETVTMRMLSSPDYLVVSPTDVELVIADDDVLVSVSAVKDAIESPRTNGVVRLNLSSPAPKNLTIPLDLVTGSTAVAETDYSSISSTAIVPKGSTGIDIEIVPIVQAGLQGTRLLSVSVLDTTDIILAGSGGGAGAVAVINIRDGTAAVSFGTVTLTGPSGNAGENPVTAVNFTVRAVRSGADNPDLIVPVVVSGAAIPGIDYEVLPSTITLPGLLAASTVTAGSSFIQVVLNASTDPVNLPAGSTLRIGTGTIVTLKSALTVGVTPIYAELTSALPLQINAGTSIGVTELLLPLTPIADVVPEGSELVSIMLTQPGDANFVLGSSFSASVAILDDAEADVVVVDPKPAIGSGSSSSGGCGMGGASALILLGLGLGATLRRRR